jgi:hypothetical protein
MVVVPLAHPAGNTEENAGSDESGSNHWVRLAAGGSLLAGGILFLNRKHRAGLVAAVAGTTLVMLSQRETVRTWWNALPGLIDDAGRVLGQVQGVVDNLDTQREKLRALVGR